MVQRFISTKPEHNKEVFATRLGWASLNKFTHDGFEVVYEVPNLDSILIKNGVDITGVEVGSEKEAVQVSLSYIGSKFSDKQIEIYSSKLDGYGLFEDGVDDKDAEPEPEPAEPETVEEPEPEAEDSQPELEAPQTDSEEENAESGETYTFDELVALDMGDLRDIGDRYGVKDVSKKGLANEILQAIENGVVPK